MSTNPNAIATIQKNTVFTNVAETKDGGFWWEGLEKDIPLGTDSVTSWTGNENWTMPDTKITSAMKMAAHPNSRCE